jgi:hypothetical protein
LLFVQEVSSQKIKIRPFPVYIIPAAASLQTEPERENAESFPAGCFLHSRMSREVASKPWQYKDRQPPGHGWTIEDEQCQRIGGGYEAMKFRFLLFL